MPSAVRTIDSTGDTRWQTAAPQTVHEGPGPRACDVVAHQRHRARAARSRHRRAGGRSRRRKLLTVSPAEATRSPSTRRPSRTSARELQKEAARRSAMLKQPVHKLYEGATEGGEVANALVDLKMKVEELDPGQFDFEPGWATRADRPAAVRGHAAQALLQPLRVVVDPARRDRARRCGTARRQLGARQHHAVRRPEGDARCSLPSSRKRSSSAS